MRPIRDEAYLVIKKEIIRGNYQPGDRLKETALADQLGISRTPVREAMRKLEIDGLVEYIPQKGIIVAGYDQDELAEIFEVRTLLEVMIVRRAAEKITDVILEKLKQNIQRFKAEEDPETILEITEEFNELIYEASQYSKLVSLMRDTREYFKRVRVSNHTNPIRRKDAIREHEMIVLALEQRDVDLAEKYTLDHIKSSRQFTLPQQ